ncbi:MAG: aminotransferase class I/II-fold pyridoxal phosphate-dependent enzyme [Calditrichaeota bacterium]|nr:aminotransferase class I/II-fold pyridoxal phosphate-dependent enzyme [Calditrichota bacterium]
MDLFDKCKSFRRAREAMAAGYYPYFQPIESGAANEVVIKGKKVIMIGSNNYMGLTQDPRVKEAAIQAVKKYGSGCTGSRYLNGTLDIHVELEERLAAFMKREAALVFSTGMQTNLGTISAIAGKDDLIFGDRDNHASIVDACRLSFAKLVKFRHNDMNDLQRLLERFKDHPGGKLIVVDGVFSMGGDIVNLPRLVELARSYGARVMVDDAHSTGVLGANGRGTGEHFGLEDQVDIVMSTFSKSFASIGGFIAADEDVIHYIKHIARSFIFSASPPPAAVATVLACLDIIIKEPERREKLWANVRKMKKGFQELGFNTGNSETPIIPIIIGDDMKTFLLWKRLFEDGVFTNPVVSPAVPPGMSLLRTSYMATHTDEELDIVLEKFKVHGKALGII